MSHLLRVQLPDVPGSLGRVATAVGLAGGNIEAIEIVEHRSDGFAVDDVLLQAEGVMPDSIVSACQRLDGVKVLWISRYSAATNVTRDLEAVEEMTTVPAEAADRLVDLLPETFRVDWAARMRRDGDLITIVHGSAAAPEEVPEGWIWPDGLRKGRRIGLPEPYDTTLLAGCALRADGGPHGGSDEDEMVVIARRGGPQILDSEIARLAHLCGLAATIAATV